MALAILTQSSVLSPQSCLAEDATVEAPKSEKEIPLEAPSPPKQDSLDRFLKLFPKRRPGSTATTPPTEEGEPTEPQSIPGKIIFQLKDYNWEQNMNLHIGG